MKNRSRVGLKKAAVAVIVVWSLLWEQINDPLFGSLLVGKIIKWIAFGLGTKEHMGGTKRKENTKTKWVKTILSISKKLTESTR